MLDCLGFDSAWRKWIKATCLSCMSILVNGSLIMEFLDESGLNKVILWCLFVPYNG